MSMNSRVLDSSITALCTAASKCDFIGDLTEQSMKIIKDTSTYLEQLTALSSWCHLTFFQINRDAMESCPLSEIPGYIPRLRGCITRKVTDNLIQWKENRTSLCAAADEAVRACCAVDAACQAGKSAPPADLSDPCWPRPHVILETVHDCRDAFSQLQHILLVEEDDFSESADEEVPNILEDLKEVQDILKACQERLQVCRPVLDADDDDVTGTPSR